MMHFDEEIQCCIIPSLSLTDIIQDMFRQLINVTLYKIHLIINVIKINSK